MRKHHRLAANKINHFPEEIIWFDTETSQKKVADDTVQHKLVLGQACYKRFRNDRDKTTSEWLYFESQRVFWDWVVSKTRLKGKLTLIAHNIGFDLMVLAGERNLRKRGFHCSKMIINGHCVIWKWRRQIAYEPPRYTVHKSTGEEVEVFQNISIVLLDNMNFFNHSLKKLGESIGIIKGEWEEEKRNKIALASYCRNDVEIMIAAWLVWRSFILDNHLGSFAPTMASQALNTFRHRFMPSPIYVHINENATALERRGYFGGRTEAFFIGTLKGETISYYDVNSLYPYVMSKFKCPTNLLGYYSRSTLSDLKSWINDKCIMCDVEIETDKPYYPKRIEGRLCFPVGRFDTTLCGMELKLAYDRGHIKSTGAMTIYDGEIIFKEYVKWFYSSRMTFKGEGNLSFAYLCKLMLNALYGKFGQLTDDYVEVDGPVAPEMSTWQEWDCEESRMIKYKCIDGQVYEKAGKIEGYNSFAAISAHVTSNARWLLSQIINAFGPDNVLYCDTDSVFVVGDPTEHASLYPMGKALGELKLENRAKQITIRGLKDYTFKGKTTLKGIKKDAIKNKDGSYTQEQWRGLNGAMVNGDINRMLVTSVPKTLKRVYKKGIVHPSGKVSPFILGE